MIFFYRFEKTSRGRRRFDHLFVLVDLRMNERSAFSTDCCTLVSIARLRRLPSATGSQTGNMAAALYARVAAKQQFC